MTLPHIVFLDSHTLNPGDLSWRELEALGRFTEYARTAPEEVVERAEGADILIVNKTRLTESHFAALPRLRLVCVAAAGYDVVDTEAARRRGIPVCNTAGYANRAVAQMAVALLLEATNRVGAYAEANRHGFWSQSPDFCCWDAPLTELDGKRLAIVGFGGIGSTLAAMMRPFGMRLSAVSSKSAAELPPDVEKTTVEEAFATADVVSLHCPLTAANEKFVNERLLAGCRKGLILVNTARGRLVDDEAVASALDEGRLGAYATDVLSEEPPRADHPLLHAPRCYVTPHVAWATVEARSRIINLLHDNICAFMNGRPQNVVNGTNGPKAVG